MSGLGAALMIAAGGCAGPGAAEAPTAAPAPTPRTAEATEAAAEPAPVVGFEEWRAAFRGRALAAGIDAASFDAAFAGVRPNARVRELDRSQPEFTRPIWEYLDSAVSDSRVANGRSEAGAQTATLDAIEREYGVEKEIVAAIWGLESAYGFNMGSIPVVESLATLAHEGRRRGFAEEQLIEALRIVQSGDKRPDAMVGSWAGAMGHTQFIPTSYAAYAVDFTGDGRR
ncbi:MAG: lytic murein transglycosylase, partial [Pseudomonadota bacterium]